MNDNPYESPRESSDIPNRTIVIALRFVAIVLWLLAPLPVIAIGVPLLFFESGESRRELSIGIWVGASVQFFLPAIGLVLLGAACWWRRRWLALLGLYAFIPIVLLLAVALLRS